MLAWGYKNKEKSFGGYTNVNEFQMRALTFDLEQWRKNQREREAENTSQSLKQQLAYKCIEQLNKLKQLQL